MASTIEIADGLQIYCKDQGSGEPLILIPGWTCTTEFFQHNLDTLAERYRVIAYDPRSHGNSSKTEQGNNFIQRGDDLNELIQLLNLENVNLAGWSMGAYDAYAYLRKYGTNNIRSFICIDMPPKNIKIAEDDWAEGSLEEIHGLFSGIMQPDQRQLMEGYTDFMLTRKATDDERAWVVEQSLKTPAHLAALIAADAALLDFSDTARSINDSIPVLHIVREDWSATAIQWLNKNAPTAKVEVLGGHMMFWEFPEQFNKLMLDFLASL